MSTFFQLAETLRDQRFARMIEMPTLEKPRCTPRSALLLNPVVHRGEITPRTPPRAANDDHSPAPLAHIG